MEPINVHEKLNNEELVHVCSSMLLLMVLTSFNARIIKNQRDVINYSGLVYLKLANLAHQSIMWSQKVFSSDSTISSSSIEAVGRKNH